MHAIRWLVASLNLLTSSVFLLVLPQHYWTHSMVGYVEETQNDRTSEQTNAILLQAILWPAYRRLMPYRIIAILWDRQKVCQHPLHDYITALNHFMRWFEGTKSSEKNPHQNRSLNDFVQSPESTISFDNSCIFFFSILAVAAATMILGHVRIFNIIDGQR